MSQGQGSKSERAFSSIFSRQLNCRGLFKLAFAALLLAALLLTSLPAVPAYAVALVTYNGSTNAAITFGVAPYVPGNGAPQYIANNVTGNVDILSSPGGTFQNLNSDDLAHNIVSYPAGGPGPIPVNSFLFGIQNGGANAFAQPFGTSTMINSGTAVGVVQSDFAPGGGTASYSITSWTANYTSNVLIPVGTRYGDYITMAGTLPGASSASVIAAKTVISSPNAGDPFNVAGGVALPQLILAYSGSGSFVALGGPTGNNAAVLFSGLSYRGLAIDSIPLAAAVPAGDVLNVTTTLTVITDPASIDMYVPDFTGADNDLYTAAGSPQLPDITLFTPEATPEPASLALLACGMAALGVVSRRRRK